MLGFSIMMWFAAFVVLMVAIQLLKGNRSLIHGNVFEYTEDKVGYAKQLGKPCFLLSIGIFCSGIVVLIIKKNMAIIGAVILLLVTIAVAVIWFLIIQKSVSK